MTTKKCLRIVSWNIQKGRKSSAARVEHVLTGLGADIAFVQECPMPFDGAIPSDLTPERGALVFGQKEGMKRGVNGCIIASRTVRLRPWQHSGDQGWITVAEATLEQAGRTALVSFHGPTSSKALGGFSSVAYWALDRMKRLASLGETFDSVIVGGDFNCSRSPWLMNTYGPRFRDFFGHVCAATSFVDANWKLNGKETPNFVHRGALSDIQNDHFFVLGRAATQLSACYVVQMEEILSGNPPLNSDHMPVVLEFHGGVG